MKLIKKTIAVVLAMISMTMCLTGYVSASADEAASAKPQTRTVGYFPYWRYQCYSSLDFSALTHLNIAFCNPDERGELDCYIPDGEMKKIVDLAHADDVKVLAALGGGGGCDGYLPLLDTPEEMADLNSKIMTYCETYGLDGIDLDIELGSSHEIWKYYGDWVDSLRTLCDERGYELTTATARWVAVNVSPETFGKFDFINVMAYDNDIDKENHSSYEFAEESLQYFNSRKGIDKDRLVLGVPFYGRGYHSDGTIDWSIDATFSSLIEADPANYGLDKYNGISYNGAETMRRKCALAKDYGGIMIWEVTQDAAGEYSLLRVIRDEMKSAENDESSLPMDYNKDNSVDIFDMVAARRSGATAAELKALSSFLLGKNRKNVSENGYKLIWSDEFSGNSLDMDKWSYDLGNWKLDDGGNYITGGWGNNEQEFYTSRNTAVKDGVLTISARHESFVDEVQGSYEYTSSRITTAHKFSTCGGKIEVRARCDAGRSLWPAIWMLPEDSAYGGWASSGEIDIMEGWGSTPGKICGTIHFGGVWPGNTYLTNDYYFPEGDGTQNWHTYSIEWERGEIRWYVDDILYSTQNDWYSEGFSYPAPFDQNFYIILNLAVGGHFDGIDGIYADPDTFADGEKNFDIDYVRVYEKEGSGFVPSVTSSLPLDNYIEGAEASVVNKEGCTVVDIRNAGSLEYAVMGLLRARKVKAGERHTISFDISSTVKRSMVLTAEDSSYDRYLDEKLTITPERKHYSFDIVFDKELKADIKFQLGNVDGASALGAHEVTISDISWR